MIERMGEFATAVRLAVARSVGPALDKILDHPLSHVGRIAEGIGATWLAVGTAAAALATIGHSIVGAGASARVNREAGSDDRLHNPASIVCRLAWRRLQRRGFHGNFVRQVVAVQPPDGAVGQRCPIPLTRSMRDMDLGSTPELCDNGSCLRRLGPYVERVGGT